MEEAPQSQESTFEEQIERFREQYKNLEDERNELLEPLKDEWHQLYQKWRNKLGLDKEWRDVTENIVASMDGIDKEKYNYMIGLENIFDQRALELYDSLLNTVIDNPSVNWIHTPRHDSFAGRYNKECKISLGEDVDLSLLWMTQPKNAQDVMFMPNGADKERALRNRMDVLSLSINEKRKGPLSVKNHLGISVTKEYGTDNEYRFSEDMRLQFPQKQLDGIKTNMVHLKEQQFGDDFDVNDQL